MRRKLGIAFLSALAVAGCGGDAQLRSEMADLRVSLQAVEARQDKLEQQNEFSPSPSSTPEVAVLSDKNSDLEAELAKLRETQLELLEQINQRPVRRPRPRPDKAAVYAIDLGQSPFLGPKNAKVTIVEAFEFS